MISKMYSYDVKHCSSFSGNMPHDPIQTNVTSTTSSANGTTAPMDTGITFLNFEGALSGYLELKW